MAAEALGCAKNGSKTSRRSSITSVPSPRLDTLLTASTTTATTSRPTADGRRRHNRPVIGAKPLQTLPACVNVRLLLACPICLFTSAFIALDGMRQGHCQRPSGHTLNTHLSCLPCGVDGREQAFFFVAQPDRGHRHPLLGRPPSAYI